MLFDKIKNMKSFILRIKSALKNNEFIYRSFGNIRFLRNCVRDLLLKQKKSLRALKNKYFGESCFIVATGPSLTLDDLNLIKGFFSFSCNSIVSSFDKTSWRPDFYCISDKEILSTYSKIAASYNLSNIFLPNDFKRDINISYIGFHRSFAQHIKSIYYGTCKNIIYPSKKPDRYFNDSTSVVFICIQIAVYLGFKTIYLLGQDCNYSGPVIHSEIAKTNHKLSFDKKVGDAMIDCFENYKEFYEKRGIEIINCTRGGKLEVFPRKKLDDIVGKC